MSMVVKYFAYIQLHYGFTIYISVKPGVRYRDIGAVIQKHAQANGFSVVRSYCGHGIHQYVIPIFSSIGHRPEGLCHGLVSVVGPYIPSFVNFYFKNLLPLNYLSDFDEISQKCSCHGPLQNFLKEFDSFKNSGCHGNKT